MTKRVVVVVLGLSCFGALCSTGRPALVVADTELNNISAEDRTALNAQAETVQTQEGTLAIKRLGLKGFAREVRIAGLAIKRDDAAAEIAKLSFEAAQEGKNAETLASLQKNRDVAVLQLERDKAQLILAEANEDLAEQEVAVLEAELQVTRAKLELAKAEAAAKAKGTPADARLAEFKSQLADTEAALAKTQIAFAQAKEGAAQAQQRVSNSDARLRDAMAAPDSAAKNDTKPTSADGSKSTKTP